MHFGLIGRSCLVFVGLLVGFRWTFGGQPTLLRMGVLEAQDGAVVGVVWPLPSSLASDPLRILNEHFQLYQPPPVI